MAERPETPEREKEKLREIRDGTGCNKELLLSIDGGGVRNYASLLILEALQRRILDLERFFDRLEDERSPDANGLPRPGRHEPAPINQNLSPCLYFDYVVGASTGAIIAIMLGRLRMPTRNIIREFKKFGLFVFGRPQGYRFFHINRYSNKRLDAAMLKLLDNYLSDSNDQSRPDRLSLAQPTHLEHECRTALVSIKQSQDADQAFLLRSYQSQPCASNTLRLNAISRRPLNPGDNSPIWIHQALKAAVSTPFFFHETVINGNGFVDGGVWFNNPTLEAFWEATGSHQHREPPFQCDSKAKAEAVGAIISLGSGNSKRWKTSKKMQYGHRFFASGRRTAYERLSDPDATHDQMRRLAQLHDIPYFRFDVETGMDKIDLDAWSDATLREIDTATRRYLDLDTTIAELNRAAEYVVAFRRGRKVEAERIKRMNERIRNGPHDTRGPQRGHLPTGRAPHLSIQREEHTASDFSDIWAQGITAQSRASFDSIQRAQTWQPGNRHTNWQGPWQPSTIPDHPQEMLTPPPTIDLPNIPELPDHRQERLEAGNSFVPMRLRAAATMPHIPATAYRFS